VGDPLPGPGTGFPVDPGLVDPGLVLPDGFGSPPEAIASDARLARLLRAAHRRLEASGGAVEGVAAVIRHPSDDERQAVDRRGVPGVLAERERRELRAEFGHPGVPVHLGDH